MPASYPSAAKTFTTKSDGPGNTILAAHVNDLQLEVTAIEQDLIAGLPLTRGGTGLTSLAANRIPYSTGSALTSAAGLTFDGATLTAAALSVSGAFTIGGALTVNAVGTHSITGGSNAAQTLALTNTTSGTAGKVEELQTAGTAVGRLATFSQGFTTSGLSQLSSTLLDGQGAGGLSVAASNASGAVRFYAGGTTQRAQLNSAGDLLVGAITALPSGATIGKAFEAANAYAMRSSVTTTAAQAHIQFYNGNGAVGDIQTSASATAYNTSSDKRLKIDLGPAADLSALKAVQVRDFAWKADNTVDRGVFAQDAYPLFPRAVSPGSEDDLSRPWSVDYSKFVAHLIAGYQDQERRITALEAQLAARG